MSPGAGQIDGLVGIVSDPPSSTLSRCMPVCQPATKARRDAGGIQPGHADHHKPSCPPSRSRAK